MNNTANFGVILRDLEGVMPFRPVDENAVDDNGGKFTRERREFFNACGAGSYMGTIGFKDAMHQDRHVPIFDDECLEGKAGTYSLLKRIRKTMQMSFVHSPVYIMDKAPGGSVRSIHQNENGYLPYKSDGPVERQGAAAPSIMASARLYGELPHNQRLANASTKGQFLEFTFDSPMHVECRFIVDYRFGIVYMTLGHYNRDSFAMLVRSKAELDFEIKPTLVVLNVSLEA